MELITFKKAKAYFICQKAYMLLQIIFLPAFCVILLSGCKDKDTVVQKSETMVTTQWAKTVAEGNARSMFYAVATDSNGNIYAGGGIGGTVQYNFGNDVTAIGTGDGQNESGVLVKYNELGTAQWVKYVAASSDFSSIAVDSNGNIYAGVIILEPGQYYFENNIAVTSSAESENGILVKYDKSGAIQWAKTVTADTNGFMINSIEADKNGNIYVVGYIYGREQHDFGNNVMVIGSSEEKNGVLVKYNSAGIAQWAKTVTEGEARSMFQSVAVDNSGNVYVVGNIIQHPDASGKYNFGDGVMLTLETEFNKGILVKYDASGITQWAKTVETESDNCMFNSVAVDRSGSIYVCVGETGGTGDFNFGNDVTVNGTKGQVNCWLVKYAASGAAQWAAKALAKESNNFEFTSIEVDKGGHIYVAGRTDGKGQFNFGNGVTENLKKDSGNILLVKYDASGTAQWAAQSVTAASGNNSIFTSVAIDNRGSIYAAGGIQGKSVHNFGNGITVIGANKLGDTLYSSCSVVLIKYKDSKIGQEKRI